MAGWTISFPGRRTGYQKTAGRTANFPDGRTGCQKTFGRTASFLDQKTGSPKTVGWKASSLDYQTGSPKAAGRTASCLGRQFEGLKKTTGQTASFLDHPGSLTTAVGTASFPDHHTEGQKAGDWMTTNNLA